jgi:hypothetical protein
MKTFAVPFRTYSLSSLLFGSADIKVQVQELSVQEREDALLQAYRQPVRAKGGFPYTCAAIVLDPEVDRTYFHLIYATRNRKGVEVFKDVEKKATQLMEQARAEAKQRKRVKRTGQPELFSPEFSVETHPVDKLREHYLACAKQAVLDRFQSKRRVAYEELWDLALSLPLVWESDLKEWIHHWQTEGRISLEGLEPRQRVPQCEQGITVVWNADASS